MYRHFARYFSHFALFRKLQRIFLVWGLSLLPPSRKRRDNDVKTRRCALVSAFALAKSSGKRFAEELRMLSKDRPALDSNWQNRLCLSAIGALEPSGYFLDNLFH